MTKQELLKNLKENVYCRIGPSKIHGVGVIAVRDIPKGTDPFAGSFMGQVYAYSEAELVDLHPEIKKMLSDFFFKKEKKVLVPACGLNGMDISYFMNHSENPNIITKNGDIFSALRNIKANEELTFKYELSSKVKE